MHLADIDGLPVNHELPSNEDERRFQARLRLSGGNETQLQLITYSGNGAYKVQLKPPSLGVFTLSLDLDAPDAQNITVVAQRMVEVSCPESSVSPFLA